MISSFQSKAATSMLPATKKLAMLMAGLVVASTSFPAAFAEDRQTKNGAAFANDKLIQTSAADALDLEKLQAAPKSTRPKIGLALGGGGARGAAEVGVLDVLEKEGIKYDYITGTSIGSIVGGMYDAGVPIDVIKRDFLTGQLMSNFMTIPLALRIVIEPICFIPRILGAKPYDGLYKGNKFRKYLQKTLPTHDKNIEELQIPFSAVSLNVIDGQPYMIRSGDLGYAMQASSAVPGLRKPVEINDGLFVDGGVACNLPVKQCRQMGADLVIAVNIDEPFNDKAKDAFRKPGSVSRRMINWDLWENDRHQGLLADIEIHPNTEGTDLVSTKKSDALRCFEAGQEAARQALPQIREKLKSLGVLTAKP